MKGTLIHNAFSYSRVFVAVLFLIFLHSRVHAQNLPPPESLNQREGERETGLLPAEKPWTETPYLVPQTIYVGDLGRLIIPLNHNFSGIPSFLLDTPDKLYESRDLVIRRIEFEHRGGTPRLAIDFITYIPGVHTLPVLEFTAMGAEIKPYTDLNVPDDPEGGNGNQEKTREKTLIISGLVINTASILGSSQTELSEPSPPLAAPGTGFLVYGSLAFVIALLFFSIGGGLWARKNFAEVWDKLRRRHLLRAMDKFLRRLRQEGELGKYGNAAHLLTLLSSELREFLSFFTRVNCRSLTAAEFLDLPLDTILEFPEGSVSAPVFLCGLFRVWDTLRFSGSSVEKEELFRALDDTIFFMEALSKAEKDRAGRRQKNEQEGVTESFTQENPPSQQSKGEAYEYHL